MNKALRIKKHKKIRKKIRRKIKGDNKCPRLAVFKSHKHIYAQIIDDIKGITLASESDSKIREGLKSDKAYQVGKSLAKKALKNKISAVVFDRGGFLYHGRIAQLAKGAREGGLKF